MTTTAFKRLVGLPLSVFLVASIVLQIIAWTIEIASKLLLLVSQLGEE